MTGRTDSDWEGRIGQHFRALRIGQGLDQEQLAHRASVSLGAVRNLENGRGSSLKTVIRAARALGQETWLDDLGPGDPEVSPMALLRQARRQPQPRRRVRNAGDR